ncbi:MAG TPA: DinB family protein [Bryobacteraceae bacterium]|jgi:uncharacterized damage-inducible protein DinB|nr:DinB family protein [Bryobacteraceae bacterium]
MKQLCLLFAALGVCSPALLAQEASSPFVNAEKGVYGYVSGMVIASAEQVPESDYSFKPTPDVRSMGQIFGHAADAQYMFCGDVAGEQPPVKDIEKTKTTKADLVQALKDAQGYCMKVYGSMDDQKAAQTVDFMGRKFPKLTIMSLNTAHLDEHYGNLVTYMRLKGIVPPSSAPRK